MNILIIVILIITVLILITYYIFNILEHEDYKQIENVYFFTKKELEDYLIKDIDDYYKNFSDKDFKVRNVNNIEEYHNNIKISCIDINDKKNLNECISIANNKLNHYKCVGFDGSKCANIIWKIGLVKDKLYEEGYPHTRHDVIIIPEFMMNNKNQLINTLIHEKIHVYQKTYPEDIELYLKDNGFTKYKLRSDNNNTRSNPDMDQWIYKNKDGEIMMAEYMDNPKSIMDVNIKPNNSSKYEHPFEYMAYDITNIL
jgi:hypothetical protein